MTLHEGQGHSNWYQTVQFCHVYHNTKFETHPFINVENQAINHQNRVFFLEYQSFKENLVQTETSQLVMATYHNLSKSNVKFARKWVHNFLLFVISVTLNESHGHSYWYQTKQSIILVSNKTVPHIGIKQNSPSYWYQTKQFSDVCDHAKFERNQMINI